MTANEYWRELASRKVPGNSNRSRGKERLILRIWDRYCDRARTKLRQASQNQWVGPVGFWDPVTDHTNYRRKKRGHK